MATSVGLIVSNPMIRALSHLKMALYTIQAMAHSEVGGIFHLRRAQEKLATI